MRAFFFNQQVNSFLRKTVSYQFKTKLATIVKNIRVFLSILSCLFNLSAFGQDYVDLVKLDYTITPVNSFDSSVFGTKMQEVNGDITIPFKLKNGNAILTGITYENTIASFDPNRLTESATGISLKLGAKINHTDKLSATYIVLPKISSDFNQISQRDFQVGAAVLMKYQRSENFNYKFGGYYNQELFGPFFVPIFGFYYLNANEKLELKALLPLSVGVNYNFIGNFSVGATYRGQIRSYDFGTQYGLEDKRYLARSTNEAYAYLQYGMDNGIHFQIHGGHSLGRSYRVYNEKVPFAMPLFYFGDNRTQLNTDFNDGWLFKVAVFYRYKI